MMKDSRKKPQQWEFSSASLSYGKASVKIEVQERNPQLEPRVEWRVGGRFFYSTDCAKCFTDLNFSVARTAIYDSCEGANAVKLASPEHLAPVFLMWPSRSFTVDVSCNEEGSAGRVAEVPLMDGSALPFFNALRRNVGVPEELAFFDAPIHDGWFLVIARIYASSTVMSLPRVSGRISSMENWLPGVLFFILVRQMSEATSLLLMAMMAKVSST